MGAYYEKVKKMTNEPGLLFLAQVADEQEQRLSDFQAALDACCEHAPLAPATAPPVRKSVDEPLPVVPLTPSSDETKG